MQTKALVVIDIQNDITKHYRDIIDNTVNSPNKTQKNPPYRWRYEGFCTFALNNEHTDFLF